MKRTFILMGAFVLLVGLPTTRGQSIGPSVFNTTGGSKITDGHEFDWSIGEVALVSTDYGSNVIITQGLLQNELSTPVKVANTALTQHLKVYPNPASSLVNLQYTSQSDGTLAYRLIDVAGKVIMQQSNEIKQGNILEQLNISGLAAATYMLEVSFKDNKDSEGTTSYKIEKLK